MIKRIIISIGSLAFIAFSVFAQEHGVHWTRFAYHITAKGTYYPTLSTCDINTVSANISNAGTAWVLTFETIQNEPRVIWQWHTADGVGNFNQINLPVGIRMTGGVQVVSSGTTAGVADIHITGRCAPNPSSTPFVTPTATATSTATATPANTPTPTPTSSATATPSATSSP